ncbi:MAG TPA: serine/threonine-protein kinase [Polyangia bacterium]|nr:serine/threonine-protein kinase [Polyangia bacterium]
MAGLEGALSSSEGTVGRYRTILLLGQGGTADVHLAVGDGPGGFRKLVVLKTLKPALGSDPELRAMFLNEARLAAQLHHPNVVQTYEVIEDRGGPVIVMEYLDGEPLSNVIVSGRGAGLTLGLQLRVLIDALAGLHAAHELRDFRGTPLGVVHRDVSPHNLFVTVEGQTKVLDFGIAKLDRSLVETEVGTVKGKIRYMAPEQLRGEVLDRRADVYSAGVILWEALAGERMWKGVGDAEIRARVGAGDLPVPPPNPGAPGALARICRRALALDPSARPPTALALADELEPVLAELGGAGTRALGGLVARLGEEPRRQRRAVIEERVGHAAVEVTRTTTELPPMDQLTSGEATPTPPPPRPSAPAFRGRVATAVVGTLVGVIAALAIARSMRGRHEPPAPPPAAQPSGPSAALAGAGAPPARVPPPPLPAGGDRSARPRAEKPASRRSPRPLPAPVEAASPAPAAPDCTHPFFIDGGGIKKLRPECM